MAVTSSKILNLGKNRVAGMLVGLNLTQGYTGIGVGEDSTAANENQSGLIGSEQSIKPGNVSYFKSTNNSYIAQWNSSWVYGDLTSHVYNEVVVNRSSIGNTTSEGLLRAVYDSVTLGSGDSLSITAQVAVSEA